MHFFDSEARKKAVEEIISNKHSGTVEAMKFLFPHEYDESSNLNHGPHFWKHIKDTSIGDHLYRYMKSLLTTVSAETYIRVLMILSALQLFLPRHRWGGNKDSKDGLVAIISLAAAIADQNKHQRPHIDYNFWKIFDKRYMIPGVTLPLVFILALQAGCKLLLYDKNGKATEIDIPEGHLFVMSGDCLHGGYTYTTINCRIHFYFESIDLVTSDKNETGWFSRSKDGIYQPQVANCFLTNKIGFQNKWGL